MSDVGDNLLTRMSSNVYWTFRTSWPEAIFGNFYHLPGFQSFFKFLHNFVLAKLATNSIRVNKVYEAERTSMLTCVLSMNCFVMQPA